LVEHRRSAGVRSDTMAWKTPKIVEIVCGAEINAYVSAEIA
jgi:coenzyme PQQ precursor peptide PqqA